MRARAKVSGLSHLSSDDRRALEAFRGGADLVGIASDHRADEIAAAIHAEMPWMAAATDFLWKAMRRSVRVGEPGFRLPPVLLDGPPGIGKSVWSRELGRHLGVPRCGIEGTAEQASFVVNGSQRGWGSAFPGRPLQTIVQSLCANPIVVIDEIEKAGTPTSTKGQAYGLAEGLLPLLERSSAVAWKCPYYQVGFDMSWISWVLTSNSLTTLPAPFLSRLDTRAFPLLRTLPAAWASEARNASAQSHRRARRPKRVGQEHATVPACSRGIRVATGAEHQVDGGTRHLASNVDRLHAGDHYLIQRLRQFYGARPGRQGAIADD
jgi:hypothetical protein